MNNDYHKSIDGLRGFALLLVLMFHQDIAYFGWTGIILFFVLSGYLITKVLMAEKEKQLPIKTKFKNFWMRRILRIFPIYYLYLLILVIGLVTKWIPSLVEMEMPWLFTYTYNFYLISVYDHTGPSFLAGHFWSLSVEEQFYLFYPFLIFFSKRKQLKFAIIGLILFSILFRLFYNVFPQHNTDNTISCFSAYSDYHPFNYLDSFLCGAAIFIFRLDKLRPLKGYFIFLFSFLITLAGGLWIYFDINGNETFNVRKYLSDFGIVAHYCKNLYRVWSQINLNLLFSSVLLLLLLPVKNKIHLWLKKFFELRPLVMIGKISYGAYVFHAIIIWLFIDIFDYGDGFKNKYIFFTLCFAAALLISFCIYHLYEKRFLALKEKFR